MESMDVRRAQELDFNFVVGEGWCPVNPLGICCLQYFRVVWMCSGNGNEFPVGRVKIAKSLVVREALEHALFIWLKGYHVTAFDIRLVLYSPFHEGIACPIACERLRLILVFLENCAVAI